MFFAGRFDINDLVFLPNKDLAVVIKTTRDAVQVLNQFSQVQRYPPQQLDPVPHSSRYPVVDMYGNKITNGDVVMISESGNVENKKRAVILHAYKQVVFAKSREVMENGGMIAAKTNMVSSMKGPSNFQQHRNETGSRSGFNDRGRGRGGMGRGSVGRGRLMAKTVQITNGPYKGYIGVVKDVTESNARVELHTNSQIITIDQAKLNFVDENGQTTPVIRENASNSGFAVPTSVRRRYDDGIKTPMYSGSRTPMHRQHESTTPNPYNDTGGRTPAWDYGSRTPNPYGSGDGGRTPAWDANARTPNPYQDGGRTPVWDVGSRTPAFGDSGGRTPRSTWDAGYSKTGDDMGTPRNPATPAADTPLGYNPSTPAAYSLRNPVTPAAIPDTPRTARRGYGPTTPMNPSTPFNPETPLNPETPFVPTTPYSGGEDLHAGQLTQGTNLPGFWLTDGIEVSISIKGRNGSNDFSEHNGKHAVVLSSTDHRMPHIKLLDSNQRIDIPVEFLEKVAPAKKDKLVVLPFASNGEKIYGHMVSAMLDDVVVRLEGGLHKMYPVSQLGKVVE
ncbi:transcription elongation factor spt5 [Nowakowskiella sp. JEL0078]|nr:transcription elongation factor spt5 [Nowakowskiella sp. JEL0078]